MGRSAVPIGKELGGRTWHLGHMGRGPWVLYPRAPYPEGERTGSPQGLLLLVKGSMESKAQTLAPLLSPFPSPCPQASSHSRIPGSSSLLSGLCPTPLFSWWTLSSPCAAATSTIHSVLLARWAPFLPWEGYWLQRARTPGSLEIFKGGLLLLFFCLLRVLFGIKRQNGYGRRVGCRR